MKRTFSSMLLLPALALAWLTPAHAQLELTGSTHGVFTGPSGLFNSINNGAVVSTFKTGLPVLFQSPSSITFTGQSFAGIGSGDTLGLGQVKIHNSNTLFNLASSWANMDLFVSMPLLGVPDFKLTTLQFAIVNTPDSPGNVPDLYYIGYTGPESLIVAGNLVKFTIDFSNPAYDVAPGVAIQERGSGSVDLYSTMSFTPVPEPSTYALFGALGLVGVVAMRRFRRLPVGAA